MNDYLNELCNKALIGINEVKKGEHDPHSSIS